MTYAAGVRRRAVAMYAAGMSAMAIERETGISHASVSRWVAAEGLKRDYSPGAILADPSHPSHGKTTGYEYGCRCALCRAARKVSDKKVQVRRTLKEIGK